MRVLEMKEPEARILSFYLRLEIEEIRSLQVSGEANLEDKLSNLISIDRKITQALEEIET